MKKLVVSQFILVLALIGLSPNNYIYAETNNENISINLEQNTTQYKIQSIFQTTDYHEYTKKDKDYLNTLIQTSNNPIPIIEEEMKILTEEIDYIQNNYYLKGLSTDTRVYSYQTTGCIYALNNAIMNREDLLKILISKDDTTNWEYNDSFLLGNRSAYINREEILDEDIQDIVINEIIKILEKSNLPKEIYNSLDIYLSPYAIYTQDGERSEGMHIGAWGNIDNKRNSIAIGHPSNPYNKLSMIGFDLYDSNLPETEIDKLIQSVIEINVGSTFYHEIGHVFLNSYIIQNGIVIDEDIYNNLQDLDLDIIKDFKDLYEKTDSSFKFTSEYSNHLSEAFANDFAYYFVNQDPTYSYTKLLTSQRLESMNEDDLKIFIEKYINKLQSREYVQVSIDNMNVNNLNRYFVLGENQNIVFENKSNEKFKFKIYEIKKVFNNIDLDLKHKTIVLKPNSSTSVDLNLDKGYYYISYENKYEKQDVYLTFIIK